VIEQGDIVRIVFDGGFLQRRHGPHRALHHGRAQRPAIHQLLDDAAIDRVVVNGENAHIVEDLFIAGRQSAYCFIDRKAQPDAETRPLIDDAFRRDFAAHQLDNVAADRQAEAGAAIAARMRTVRLLELLEHARQLIFGDADACVANRDDQINVVADPVAIDFHQHVAVLGELDCIADQIAEHLTQPGIIANDAFRQRRRVTHDQLNVFFERARLHHGGDFEHRLAQVETVRGNSQLSGLELGNIENVVDDGHQGVAR